MYKDGVAMRRQVTPHCYLETCVIYIYIIKYRMPRKDMPMVSYELPCHIGCERMCRLQLGLAVVSRSIKGLNGGVVHRYDLYS